MRGVGELLGDEARERIQLVGRTLRELASMLSRRPGEAPAPGEPEFELRGAPAHVRASRTMKAAGAGC